MAREVGTTMLAAVYRGRGQVNVEELEVPAPAPHEVLVEVQYCGVCGSDLHILVEGWGKPGTVAGHEYSGTIAALGTDVTGWAVGDLVVCGPPPRCGVCRRCRQGRPSQCERRDQVDIGHLGGAFARYVALDARALVRVPAAVPARHAALAEPLAVALHGITQAALEPGARVLVMGAGPIGALSIAALSARGGFHVVAVEPNEGRGALALSLGAHEVRRPEELEVFPQWEPERIAAEPFDAVLECSGKKAAIEAGLNQLARGGRLVLVGTGVDQPTFDPNRILLNELVITGAFIYDADGFEQALALLASPAFPCDQLIEGDDVTLDALGPALEGLAGGRIAGKVMVVPRVAG